jgi:alanine racemase
VDNPLIWAEIDLNAYAHNIRELRRITHAKARLMAVVKANGYGHGASEVAREALQNGADWLGVARIDEAIRLRRQGITAPILIFGYTPPDLAKDLIEFDLTATVYSYSTAQILSANAQSIGKTIAVHIKVDSGMGRLGVLPDTLVSKTTTAETKNEAIREIESISQLAGLDIEGVFTHFATADSADKSYAKKQLEIFLNFSDQLRQAGLEIPLTHAANSAALIHLPESHLDMVRPGIATYGLSPSDEMSAGQVVLKPALALKSKIIHVKNVPTGFNVSYGITYQTQHPTTIATVPVGYADGFSRLLSSRGHMLLHGKRVPIIGRVCMDLTMLDVGALTNLNIEDEVVILGQQGNESITADEIAARLNTINYEVVSSITARVPRIYSR